MANHFHCRTILIRGLRAWADRLDLTKYLFRLACRQELERKVIQWEI